MDLSETVVARAGVKHLQELQRELRKGRISSDILCPPGVNTNH